MEFEIEDRPYVFEQDAKYPKTHTTTQFDRPVEKREWQPALQDRALAIPEQEYCS